MKEPTKAGLLRLVDHRVTVAEDELSWLLLTASDIRAIPDGDREALRRYHNILTKGG